VLSENLKRNTQKDSVESKKRIETRKVVKVVFGLNLGIPKINLK
jgi:hypothetical protein